MPLVELAFEITDSNSCFKLLIIPPNDSIFSAFPEIDSIFLLISPISDITPEDDSAFVDTLFKSSLTLSILSEIVIIILELFLIDS